MDPVNKWLMTVIFFMIGVLVVLWYVGGAGRYEFAVEKSTVLTSHAVVYILDTKDGDVKAQLVDESELQYNNKPKTLAQGVMSYDRPRYNHRRGF